MPAGLDRDDADTLVNNPYDTHPELSSLEADVLWEYAKLNVHIKQLLAQTARLAEAPDQALNEQLRAMENKMGLVLTLYKASVWSVINQQQLVMDSADDSQEGNETYADTTVR